MTNKLHEDIDVIETSNPEGYGPDVGEPDYWIEEGENYSTDDVFGLEEGSYEMDAVELDRSIRDLSQRAHWTPTDKGVVFFANGEFCYVGVSNLDLEQGSADVDIRKGDYEEFGEEILESENSGEVSEGFFDKVVEDVEVDDREIRRQRRVRKGS